jgi:hypothetical protein
MAEEIKRNGSPKATDLKGEEFTFTVTLSEPPSKEWSRLFGDPDPAETTPLCSPKRVGMMHQAIVFKSEEANVAAWVQHLDRWIARANRALAEQEVAEKKRKAEELRLQEDKQKRIQEVNERFKDL